MQNLKYLGFFFILYIGTTTGVLGQLNIKVGYTNGFTQGLNYNGVVSNFNKNIETQFILDDALDPINSLHGLELGLRYRLNSVGFELSWSNLSKRSDAFASLDNVNRIQTKLFTSLTEYSLGAENYFGYFGYGASVGYRHLSIKTDVPGSRRKRAELLGEPGWAGKFYLLFQVPGDKVALTFKPYVQFPLSEYALDNFESGLNSKYGFDSRSSVEKERFFMYGISILLYNGQQSN